MTGVLVGTAGVESWTGPPLYLFVGISTAGSSIHHAYPHWSRLFAPGSVLRGVDLPEDAPPAAFRRLALAMRDNPDVHGAVITSHKLRMYEAIAGVVDEADALTRITQEVNSLDTRDGLRAFARDPHSLEIVLDAMSPTWVGPDKSVLCIGSGGAARALVLAMGLDIPATITSDRPVRRGDADGRGALTIVGVDETALDEVRAVQASAGLLDADVTLSLAKTPAETGDYVAAAKPGTVIANATGLGKTSPGSPLPDDAEFPTGVLAWDFNYRGPLTFLEQARRAGVATADGRDYFLAGWTAALAAITGTAPTPELFARVRESSGRDQSPQG